MNEFSTKDQYPEVRKVTTWREFHTDREAGGGAISRETHGPIAEIPRRLSQPAKPAVNTDSPFQYLISRPIPLSNNIMILQGFIVGSISDAFSNDLN